MIVQQAQTNAKLDQVYEVAEATMNNTAYGGYENHDFYHDFQMGIV